MADSKVLIADGHHRYEAALTMKVGNPAHPYRLMMAFTNLHGRGLKVLPTHRVVGGAQRLNQEAFHDWASACFAVRYLSSLADLRRIWKTPDDKPVRIAMLVSGSDEVLLLTHARKDRTAVSILHDEVLPRILNRASGGRDMEQIISYVTSVDKARELIATGQATCAFLLEPANAEHVFDFAMRNSGMMPPKSTNFFPKIPSGLLIQTADENRSLQVAPKAVNVTIPSSLSQRRERTRMHCQIANSHGTE